MSFTRLLSLCLAAAAVLLPLHRVQGQQPAQAAPIVKSIDVQYAGPANISREKILGNMRTKVGKPYD